MDNRTNIGGRDVVVGHMTATEGVKVFITIVKICGTPIFKALTSDNATKEEIGGAVLGLLAANLDSDIVLGAMNTVFNYVSIDGARASNLDMAFSGGRTLQLLQVFVFALKVNYQDFLDADLLGSLQGQAAALSR